MKFPKFMKPKTLFSGLAIAGAASLFSLANGSTVSADTISVTPSSDDWGNGMMYFSKDGVPSWTNYVVLRLNGRVVFCLDPWTLAVHGADYDYNESKYTQSVTNLGKANAPVDEEFGKNSDILQSDSLVT